MRESTFCPFCGSDAVYSRRMVVSSHGDEPLYHRVNSEKCYEDADLLESAWPQSNTIYRCGICGHFFEENMPAVKLNVSYVPVSRMKERVENVKSTLSYKTKEYKQSCISLQGFVAKASGKDLSERLPAKTEELRREYQNLCKLDVQVDTLEHILSQDVVTSTAELHGVPHNSGLNSSQQVRIDGSNAPACIEQFRGQWYFLSNFAITNIEIDGITYLSAENAFQAMKTTDQKLRKAMSQMLPSEAKKAGRKLNLRPDWDNIKLQVMADIVYKKFDQNPAMRNALLSTGDAHLQERNDWGDIFWGADLNGVGENHLGKILMTVRNQFANENP